VQALANRRKWFSLAAVNIGNFCPPLDTGIMSLIVPTLSVNLKAPTTVALWVPLESLIITAAFMPVFGRFSDVHGRKRYFILGLALFSLGAYLSGNSQTIYDLLVYRLIQATGGAFILSNGRALIVDAFEPAKRGLALGTHISTLYIGMTVGVALTGSIVDITQSVGWRYVFYANSIIAAVAIPISIVALRESPKNLKVKTDWPGAILFAAALGSALVALTAYSSGEATITSFIQQLNVFGLLFSNVYVSIPVVWFDVIGSVSAVLFVLRETRTPQPLIDFGLFRTNSMFASTNFAVLFVYMAHYGTLILLSFYLSIILQLTPLTSSFVLIIEPLFVTIFAVFGGWIAGRTSSRDPAIAGLVIVTFALVLLTTLAESTSTITISFLLAMLGAGVGIFAPANTNANLASVPKGDRATANGILGMMRATGQSVSLGIGVALIGVYLFGSHVSGGGPYTPAQFLDAIHIYFIVGAVLAAISVYFAFRGREPPGQSRELV
jgi:MFS family permease